MKRRRLMQLLGALPLAMRLPAAGAQATLRTTALGGGLSLVSGAGCNVVLFDGPEEVVVVDGGLVANAEALHSEIRRVTGIKPIRALFNTNWRPQRSGLNHLLGPQGVPIIAHENSRLWQNADFHVAWQNTDYKPLPKEVQANHTFYKTGTLATGGEFIEYGVISQCNTDGDIYVHFTKADVLVVGDMLGVDDYPVLDYVTGGWIGGAQETTAGLLARATEGTRVIAANGGVLGKAQIQAQADLLEHAYAKVAEAFQTGRSLEEFLAADPMAQYRAALGDPTLFLTLLYEGTWFHVTGRAVRNII